MLDIVVEFIMIKNYSKQAGVAGIVLVVGGLLILAVGGVLGSMAPKLLEERSKKMVDVVPTVIIVEPSLIPTVAEPSIESENSGMEKKGYIVGKLTYPSSGVPAEVGVCAELTSNTNIKTCTTQIKDKKYLTGVGFELEVEPGIYYVYAFYKDQKAYYNQFVVCGLNVSCKDRTKIPVIVKEGQIVDAMPEDWYDEVPVVKKPSATPTLAKLKLIPTITSVPVPTVSKLYINPNVLQNITFPSATPTPFLVPKIPTIKLNLNF